MPSKRIPQKHGGVLTPVDKGEVLNPWGRPPKKLTVIMKELKSKGFERVKKTDVLEAYELLLGMSATNLMKTVKNLSLPYIMRLVAKEMLSKKGSEMLERMLDRAHGRPNQKGDFKLDLPILDLTGGLKEKIDKYANSSVKKTIRGAVIRRVDKGPAANSSVKKTK